MLLTTTLTGILRETDGTPVIGRAVLINPVIRAVIAVSDGGLVLTAVSAATDDEGRLGIAAPDVPFVQGVALPVGEYDLVILGLDRKFGGRITITQDMVDAGTALLSQALELGPPAVVLSDLALLRAETIDARDGAIQAVDGAVQQALDGVDVIIADVAQDATRAETAADASAASALAAEALLADLAPFSAVPPAPAVINNYLRVNSAGDGFVYRTPEQVRADSAAAWRQTQVIAGTGLLGGGALTGNVTLDAQTLLDTDWTDGALTTPAMISPAQLAQVGGGGWEYSPVVATTSGTAFDFTGIPEGV
ncbi:hypothetical protein, partial [Roseovarius autotrophicus]|uniref:hypothetical protein n=1 Tax=Roseovarius autotrophicus TaxID=2824121 RepID=UPI001B361EFB